MSIGLETDNAFIFHSGTASAERLRIDTGGNISFGTQKVDPNWSQFFNAISGNYGGHLSFQNNSVPVTSLGNNFYINNSTLNERVLAYPTQQLKLDNAGNFLFESAASGTAGATFSFSERMRINSSGRVGIGTTGGNAGLHVANADIRCTGSAIANDGNSISMSQESAGAFINARGAHTSSRGTLNLHVSASNGGLGITGLTVNSDGSVSKYSGSFKIDHPLESKKDTHNLVHSFVEAPQADNIYRGVAVLENGSATVNLDTVSGMTEGTFVALNTNTLCFTSNETDWDAVKGIVKGNILTINCQNTSSMATVSWLVIGERQDQHMIDANWTDENGKIIVEPQKESEFSFLKENKNDELEL
jgi:hypothetical protein